MNEPQRKRALALYLESPGPARALLVDSDAELAAALEGAGAEVSHRVSAIAGRPFDAEDLWFGTWAAHYRAVYFARTASARVLYQGLYHAGRLVASDGFLAILCPTDAVADHAYQEATEVFLSTHPGWARTLHQASNVIEVRRGA